MKNKSSNLYQLAREAKNRLRNNSYQNYTGSLAIKEPEFLPKAAGASESHTPRLVSYDEILYKRVCEILNNQACNNPVNELIDKKIFGQLDMESKQKYIHNLNLKFRELKTRYFKEHGCPLEKLI